MYYGWKYIPFSYFAPLWRAKNWTERFIYSLFLSWSVLIACLIVLLRKRHHFLLQKHFALFLVMIVHLTSKSPDSNFLKVSSANHSKLLLNWNTIGFFCFCSVTSNGKYKPWCYNRTITFILYERLTSTKLKGLKYYRCTPHYYGQVLPMKHIKLTFNSRNLPTRIKAAYQSFAVRPYIWPGLRVIQLTHKEHLLHFSYENYCRN